MFRIRRIFDSTSPANRGAIAEIKRIFRAQFPAAAKSDIDTLEEKLSDPMQHQFRAVVLVAENSKLHTEGFAVVFHDPKLKFSYLDFIATQKGTIGRGVGAALYETVRDEAFGANSRALLFECLPDDPGSCEDEAIRAENIARLRFYERYGARPILGTEYERPVPGGSADCLPHLVLDGLGRTKALDRRWMPRVVRAILERKYAYLCPPEYITEVSKSFDSSDVALRPLRYVKSVAIETPQPPSLPPIVMTVNEEHDIHHIRERGYVEAPVRIRAIADKLEEGELVRTVKAKRFAMDHVYAVHDRAFVNYLRRACELTPEGRSVYPYVFPIRNATRPPKEMTVRAGYYCIDTFTPIHRNAFKAARGAVDCALTAAKALIEGERMAYALVRPPGHHAERGFFGGFCYLNNNAVAAHYLSGHGKVAILDVDYHHGNGQQDIFYQRADVLTVSIHGDPSFAYPYFTGFADESGDGVGSGYNLNLPQPEKLDGKGYLQALRRALAAIEAFGPTFVVIALGLDPAKGDPTGTWSLKPEDFERNGERIGSLRRPMLVVQEGGYRTRTLGANARAFLTGLRRSLHAD